MVRNEKPKEGHKTGAQCALPRREKMLKLQNVFPLFQRVHDRHCIFLLDEEGVPQRGKMVAEGDNNEGTPLNDISVNNLAPNTIGEDL